MKILSIEKKTNYWILTALSGAKYVYEPCTKNLCGDPEWRRIFAEAEKELASWNSGECPAYIVWNCNRQPLLEYTNGSTSTIQPFIDGWEGKKWLVDPFSQT